MEDDALAVGFSQQSSEALMYNLGITGAHALGGDEGSEDEEPVILNVAGIHVQVPAHIGRALVAEDLPGAAVLQLLRNLHDSSDSEGEEGGEADGDQGESIPDDEMQTDGT
mmetsp:Transcript_8891/g.17392  ORF Transcript_8891/g.17392 Transcript_8891/m.17392 type:complete len:111 (+) Transcript_8891:1-333(+)